MGTIMILNKVKWKPQVTAKLLTVKEIELTLSFSDDGIDPDQRAQFGKIFMAAWEPKFKTLKADKTRKVQDAINTTEKNIAAKKTDAEKKQVVATANQLLKQAMTAFQQELAKACDECIKKAGNELANAQEDAENMATAKSQALVIAKEILMAVLTHH